MNSEKSLGVVPAIRYSQPTKELAVATNMTGGNPSVAVGLGSQFSRWEVGMYHPLLLQTVALLGLRLRYWVIIIVVILVVLALAAMARNRNSV